MLEGRGTVREASISFCTFARKPADRVHALLSLIRPVVDEIVLAVDRTGDTESLEVCASLADRRFLLEPAPLNQRLGWLQSTCHCDWILRLEDDEVPSAALLRDLRSLARERHPTHFALARRWLFPTQSSYITTAPWSPDYQVRLIRNIPGIWRFPARLHEPIAVLGEGRLVDRAIYHCECVLATPNERRRKREAYDSVRSDHFADDFPVNMYYTPEDWPGVETAEVSVDDLELIESAGRGTARPAETGVRAPVEAVDTGSDLEPWNATRACSPDAYGARIKVVRPLSGFRAGGIATREVVVRNLGAEWWPWADEEGPPIRLGYRWRAESGAVVREGRASFTERVGPGQETRVLVPLQEPPSAGDYLLELDMVHEGVRWFGCSVTAATSVGPSRNERHRSGAARRLLRGRR